VRTDPEWRPFKDHFSGNRRVLPDDIKDLIAHFIRINFVSLGRLFDQPILKPLILALASDFVAESISQSRQAQLPESADGSPSRD
jgi:hypothetical protein